MDNLAELVGAKAVELGEERLKQLGKEHTASFCASRKAVVCLFVSLFVSRTNPGDWPSTSHQPLKSMGNPHKDPTPDHESEVTLGLSRLPSIFLLTSSSFAASLLSIRHNSSTVYKKTLP